MSMDQQSIPLRPSPPLAVAVLLALALGSATVEAAFPGINGGIIFTSTRDTGTLNLFTMTPTGASQVNLNPTLQHEFGPSYSADGQRIAFTRDFLLQNKIISMNADASGQTLLTGPGSFNTTPVWSPSGAFIAFASNRSGNSEIWVMTSDGLLAFPVTSDPESDFDPAWSPDGTRIAFTRGPAGGDQNIVVLTLFPFAETVITTDPADDRGADWSPDGTQIAFMSDRSGNLDVYVMDADGSNVVQITSDPAFDNIPAWSPDGTLLAFTSNRSGATEVWLANADGSGGLTQLTSAGGGMPSWQPIPPAAAVQALRGQVAGLVAAGSLSKGNGNALDKKLAGALKKIEQLNVPPAVGKLGAFVNQVSAFMRSGKLSAAEGQPLIDAARVVMDYLLANGVPVPVEPETIDIP